MPLVVLQAKEHIQTLLLLLPTPLPPLPAAGLEAAVSALQRSNVQLCALGADGDVLRQLGLPVHVAPPEVGSDCDKASL